MDATDFSTVEQYIDFLKDDNNKYKVRLEELEKENEKLLKKAQTIDEMEKAKREMFNQSVACLRVVSALVENSHGHGATHRMRDFYCESIMVYVEKAINSLERTCDPLPF